MGKKFWAITVAFCISVLAPLNSASASPPDSSERSEPGKTSISYEPISYKMWCRDVYGNTYYVNELLDCTRGNVKFRSTKDGRVNGTIDVAKVQEWEAKKGAMPAEKAWQQCKANFYCSNIVVAAATFAFGKFKVLWKVLRGAVS